LVANEADWENDEFPCPDCSGTGKDITRILEWLAALEVHCDNEPPLPGPSRHLGCSKCNSTCFIPKYPMLRERFDPCDCCKPGDCCAGCRCDKDYGDILDPELAAMRLLAEAVKQTSSVHLSVGTLALFNVCIVGPPKSDPLGFVDSNKLHDAVILAAWKMETQVGNSDAIETNQAESF
jgi:hypothetical protein